MVQDVLNLILAKVFLYCISSFIRPEFQRATKHDLMPSFTCMVMPADTTEPFDEADATYIDHARRLLTQVYYRQNRTFFC